MYKLNDEKLNNDFNTAGSNPLFLVGSWDELCPNLIC